MDETKEKRSYKKREPKASKVTLARPLTEEEIKEREILISMLLAIQKMEYKDWVVEVRNSYPDLFPSAGRVYDRMRSLGITYPFNKLYRQDRIPPFQTEEQIFAAGFIAPLYVPPIVLSPNTDDHNPEVTYITVPPPAGKKRFNFNGFEISSATEKEATDWYNFLTNH